MICIPERISKPTVFRCSAGNKTFNWLSLVYRVTRLGDFGQNWVIIRAGGGFLCVSVGQPMYFQ